MRQVRKKKQKNMSYQRIAGLVCVILGLLFTAAFFLGGDGGLLQFADKVQSYLLGKGAFFLPLGFFAASWQLLAGGQLHVFNKKTLVFALVMLCLTGTAHAVFVPVSEELAPEQLPLGGGLIGGIVLSLLRNLAGEILAYMVLFIGWLLSLYLLLPVHDWWELLQDKLTQDEITLIRPAQAKSEDAVATSSYTKQPAQKFTPTQRRFPTSRSTTKAMPQASAAARKQSLKHDIYNNPDFKAFTDGVQKPSGIKRILPVKEENIYTQPLIKEEIERDPVQIPDFEAPRGTRTRVYRPVVDYEQEEEYVPDARFLDDEEPQETSVPQGYVGQELVEKFDEPAQQEKRESADLKSVSIATSIFSDVEKAEPVVSQPAAKAKVAVQETPPSAVREIHITDSAEKINAHGEAAPQTQDEPVQTDGYRLPPLDLLDMPKTTDPATYQADILDQCAVLEQTLRDFKVRANVIDVTRGPSVTRFELEPAPGVKVSSVVNLADDIALRLAAPGVRIEAPIPGKSAIGIEAPNTKNDTVCFREVVDDEGVRKEPSKLCIGLGKDISGNIISADLSKMPHLLVAGSTGSGKSVCINTIIAGILYKARPEEVKLILVDPKVVELSNYNGIPHLLTPVVTEPKKAASALHWAVAEMERRYKAFADNHVREIKSYNEQATEKMPYIVIIIDELSDLMMVAKVDVEDAILRLAQKARAAGIHLILATQRPSVDVITGIVKANIPSRIAFAVSSQTDSRTILDMGGAEKLLGKGDMLFYPIGMNKPVRVQGAFVTDAELNKIVDFIVKQSIPVNYSEEVTAQKLECDEKEKNNEKAGGNTPAEDELFEDALRLVLDMGQASSSMLQRRFGIGYNRAARLVDTMEELGIVGQYAGSKPREVIISRQEAEERFLHHE